MRTMIVDDDGADTASRIARWQREIAEIIANLEVQEFPRVLDRCLERLVPFDLTVIFAYPFLKAIRSAALGLLGRKPI